MAITYPVDVENTRWAILYSPTGEIVARNKVWPVADGGPIQGQDPDYVYLLQIKAAQPEYDPRLYTLEGVEEVDVPANEIRTTWDSVKRPEPDQITAAENEEMNQLSLHVELVREAIETRLMLGAVLYYALDGQTFPAKPQAMADDYKAKALKLWNNRNRLDEIVDQITQGLEPDLDAGWEPVV